MRSSFILVLAVASIACVSDSLETSHTGPMIVNAVNQFGESVGFIEARPGVPRAAWRAPNGVTIDLGTLPGGSRSSAVAVDDALTIVGQSETAGGAFHAVRWHHGIIEDLGTLPGGDCSVASAVDGDMVLGESTARDGMLHAFRWQNGMMIDLGRLSVAASAAAPPRRADRR